MRFSEAYFLFKMGKKVRRKCWDESEGYVWLENGYFMCKEGLLDDLSKEALYRATDWEVEPDKDKGK